MIEPLGETRAVGGIEVPDRIVDFPALVGHLRQQVRRRGGVAARGIVRQILINDRRVTGVELADGRSRIDCSLCVLAAGAWSGSILRDSGIHPPDLILRKCVVFEYDGELVPGLTTCLDITGHDGTEQSTVRIPAPARTASNAAVKSEPRSRIMYLIRCVCSPRSMIRLRACWAVHSPVGCKVPPRMRIRLLARSITARTYAWCHPAGRP